VTVPRGGRRKFFEDDDDDEPIHDPDDEFWNKVVDGQDSSSLLRVIVPPKAAGYATATFCAAVGSWIDMKTAGFTASEAQAAGCDISSARTAGYDVHSLTVAFGYDAVISSGCAISSEDAAAAQKKVCNGCSPLFSL
jgi:hypothetical protein